MQKLIMNNPKIIKGNEASELNREEGYEMLYFINSLGKTWKWSGEDKGAYQKLEKTIRQKFLIIFVLMLELKHFGYIRLYMKMA